MLASVVIAKNTFDLNAVPFAVNKVGCFNMNKCTFYFIGKFSRPRFKLSSLFHDFSIELFKDFLIRLFSNSDFVRSVKLRAHRKL